MPFKISKPSSTPSESPEALFRDLRARKIQGLLAHQADLLRDYFEKAVSSPDIAFQLPTGSGKTLVGLLIGEWRRRTFKERVVYLCPTNQLVHQVAEQANNQYGIKVSAFTGSKYEYDPNAKTDYLNADCMAITSYSALFNISPFFHQPNVIILDDAHSSENYIASFWSLRINRYDEDQSSLFTVLVSILKKVIPQTDFQKFTTDEANRWDIGWVDKLPTPDFYQLIPEITSTIDAYVKETDLSFSWQLIRDHLSACHLYYSVAEILIRPFIAPTFSHLPFANAKQRIYMSATLGEGGELERITGRQKIQRLEVPPGWDRQGIGRRLFLFPERSLNEEEANDLVIDAIAESGRTLVLVPDDRTGRQFRETIAEKIGYETFDAKQIEISKTPFISNEKAVAVIANRYDGIDFPDEQCRLLVIHGLPRATNLQERFIITRMGAIAMLNDRILTRIVQAFGRCTRSATDYAAIIIRGEELNTFLTMREKRNLLHPELQAELEFGLEQSKEMSAEGLKANLQAFLNQSKEWQEADEHIIGLRMGLSQDKLPGYSDLRASVEYEINYQTALWQGNYVSALDEARKVLAKLNSEELKGYRALWNYLAGAAAGLATQNGEANLDSISRDYYKRSLEASGTIRWLVRLSRTQRLTSETEEDNSKTIILIERLENVLEKLGTTHDYKYSQEEKFIIENLSQKEYTKFEEAQVRLGRLLGFDVGNEETSGSPDPWWIVDENLCFIFEDHSDADEKSRLSVAKARQVATHPNWAHENLPLDPNAEILPILVTPVKSADREALPHLTSVYLWSVDDFRKWAKNALGVIRELRSTFPGPGDLMWRATAAQKYNDNKMSPRLIIEYLKSNIAKNSLK